MNHPYKPIACSLYDILEAAAMKGRILRLTVGGAQRDVTIRDVFAKGAEEFLIAVDKTTGDQETIRLDRIELITDLSSGTVYTSDRC